MTVLSCHNWGPSSVNQCSCLNKLGVTVLKKVWSSLDPFINLLFKTISCKYMYCLAKYNFLSQIFADLNHCTTLIIISVRLCRGMHFGVLSKSWSYQTAILGNLFTTKLLKSFQNLSRKCTTEKSEYIFLLHCFLLSCF